jgi:hypothetical protein
LWVRFVEVGDAKRAHDDRRSHYWRDRDARDRSERDHRH